ncbi:hypothetical protein EBR66_06145 [bacterium]|nr:hypothetical protein [bacterium]
MEYIKKIVFGLEGCGKSSKTLSATLAGLLPGEFAFYAGISYASLREKQSWLIATFGGDDRTFPICALTVTEKNSDCVRSHSDPFRIPDEAKIVLITQACVCTCNWEKLVLPSGSRWNHLIIDEYSFSSTMVPGYDHQLLELIKGKIPDNSIGSISKSFKRQVLSKYSQVDLDQILEQPHKPFFIPHWIRICKGRSVTILTSEKLAVLALTSLGFGLETIDTPNFLQCVVHVHAAQINTTFFDHFNEGKWKLLDFDTIITNRSEGDQRCVNHTIVRGSNSLIGQRVVAVVGHVPNSHLKKVSEAISTIGETQVAYDEVFKLFYRDVICQALGRTIGHRGGESTHLLISHLIWDAIKDELSSIGVPYSFSDWQIPRNLAAELKLVRELSLAKADSLKVGREARKVATRMAAKTRIETFIAENFQEGDGFLTYPQISAIFEQHNLLNQNLRMPQPGSVAKVLSLKKSQRWHLGAKTNCVEGVVHVGGPGAEQT